MSPSLATSVRRAPTLLVALVLLFTALALSPIPAEAGPAETFADDFQSADFTGSTGSLPWAGPWIETGESDGATAGTIRVDDEPNCLAEPCLLLGRDPGPDASVEREVDLSSFGSATLTFDYKVHWHPPGGGSAELRVSDDGGGNWVALDSWPLGTSTADLVGSYDLTPFRAANTRIMFAVTGNSNDSHMNVDNLAITASPDVCYLVGSNGVVHQLTTLDLTDPDPLGAEVTIGETGADITSISLDPATGTLYAATADQLHTVDKGSGAITTLGPFGSSGTTVFNQVSGLAFDPTSGVLYASHHRDGQEDLIFQVNPTTGALASDAFGPGIDHVIFVSDKASQDSLLGLAVDTAGQMWGMGWDGNSQEKLHTINKLTGAAIDQMGSYPVSDLTVDRAGTLWGMDPAGVIFEIQSQNNDRDVDNLTTYAGLACETAVVLPPPDPGEIVISEVSHRNDDFIELYNAGSAAVDINNYRVRLDGTGTSHLAVTQGGGAIILPPGGHYLLAEAGSGLDGTADQTMGFGLPSDLGIRLRDSDGVLVDEYGHGGSPWSEGSPLPSMPAGTDQSYERLNGSTLGNCQDTDNNRNDFVHNWGFANPQNMADPPVPCDVPIPASHIVISEFRPEGPAGTDDEFVELFNPTALAVDISGWVFHITQPGLFRDYHTVPGATILDPGEHYLLSDDAGPTPADAQPYDIATDYSPGWADVVLKNNFGTIIDVLGYGSSGFGQLFEGTTLPPYDGGTADRSFVRRGGGYTDTDDNMADFVYAFAATPEAGNPGPNRAPAFDQDLGDRTDAEGALINIAAPATDPDFGNTLTYTATGLPGGVTIDPATGTITGALSATSTGNHAVTLIVTDDGSPALAATDTFAWTVVPGEVTYLVANSGGANGGDDLLTVVDMDNFNPITNEVDIGTGTGTTNIEAAALQPGSNVLFAAEDGQLGTIHTTTGVFTAKPSIAGVGSGSVGLVVFDEIEGLSFDPFSGELFATHRRGIFQEDLLLRLDPTTGAHVPGAFGGDDYITIQNQGPYWHSADIAFDPTDGQLYVVHWTTLGQWSIATLDPVSGATTTKGSAPQDLVSLAFDETGKLYSSTNNGGLEVAYQLSKSNASIVSFRIITNASNYGAMAIAFPVNPNLAPVFNQDLTDRTTPEGTVVSLSAAATDPDADDNVTYTATGLPPGLSIDSSSGLISGTISFASAGIYPVETTVTDDGIPNLSTADTFIWTVSELNQAPSFDQDIPDQLDAEGAAVSLSAGASDPDIGDVLTYGATGLPPGVTIDTASGLIGGTIDYSAAAASPYTVVITVADDGSPNQSAPPDTFTWIVSNTNQAPAIVDPGAQTTPELAPFSIVIAASDPDGQIPSFSDGGTLPPWATLVDNLDGTATIGGMPGIGGSGTTTVTISANDGGSPDLADTAVFDLTVTNTNVQPTITNPGNQAAAEAAPFSVVITASDPDGTTVSFTDSGTLPGWATLTDHGDDTATISGTPGYADAAITTVTITASDGSLADDAVFDITVANTNRAPTVVPIADQTIAENTALLPVIVTATDPDATIPALAAAGLPGWASFLDNGDGTGTISGTPGYTDAAITTVTINAQDGGTPNLTATTTFDLTVTNTNRAPVADPVADQTVAEGSPLPPVTVTTTDPDGTIPALAATGLPGWASFLDNGDGTGTISGTPGYTDAAITTVTINAEDGGTPNLTATTSFDLTVTNTDRAPVVAPIADQTVAEGDAFSLVVTATDPDGAIPSWSSTSLPGWAELTDMGDGTATITGTPGYSDAGTTTVTVTASDGPTTTDEVFDVVVANTNRPPVFVVSQPDATSAEGVVVSLPATATDPDLDPIGYAATGLPAGLLIDGGTGLITGTISPVAAVGSPYSVTVTATDQGAPSLSATDSFTWTVTDTNRPPVFDQDLANRANAEGASVSLSATATDPDLPADTLTYSATGLPPGIVISPTTGLISGTTSISGIGVYPTVIAVTDSGVPNLSATDSFTWTVTNTNQSPIFDPIESQVGPEQTEISFVVSATDPDGDVLTFSLAGEPAGAVIDPSSGAFSWTPSEADGTGSYAVTVIVTDSGNPQLGDSKVVAITVVEANLPPSLAPVADQTTGEASSVSLKITAADPDIPSNVIDYSAVGLPPGLSIDPSSGLITGTTAAGSAGTYDVVVKATDDASPALQDSAAFTWVITNSNRNPVLQPIGPQSGPEGSTISFTATAIDPDGDDLSYSLTGGPTGATIDPHSGLFVWTPGESHGPGTFTVYVLATDNGTPALADSQSVTITISETNLAPSIAPLVDQLSEAGDSVLLDVTATDPDLPANTLTYTATGLPPGISTDPATGAISGTIAADATDTSRYPVVVTVTDDGSPGLSATATFTWTVTAIEETEVNVPPVISPIGDQYTSEGSAVSLAIGATDSGLVSFGAVGLPPGLSIDASTGFITGTATADAVGSHSVTVTVTDSETPAMHANTTFGWTVTNVAAAEQKDDLVDALGSFETDVDPSGEGDEEENRLVRRGLVVMGGAAAATTDALRLPLALLIALLVGFATIGRVGLYPLLWRGERQTGTITMFDPELNFGFIAPDEPGEAVHVHANAFPRRIRPTLTTGMRVRYRVLDSDNRASAWGATPDE